MKKHGFLREANGDLSMARLAVLLANIDLLFAIMIWGIVCLRTNTIQEFPWHIALLALAANGWKALQKFAEEKVQTEGIL